MKKIVLYFLVIVCVNATAQEPLVGILANGVDVTTRIKVLKAAGVTHVRTKILIEDNNGKGIIQGLNECFRYVDSGFRLMLNVNYRPEDPSKIQWAQDTATYKDTLAGILNQLKNNIDVVAIENEENNLNYHAKDIPGYLRQLRAAKTVCDSMGLPVTNGGTTMGELKIAYYHDLVNAGLTAQASAFLLLAYETKNPSGLNTANALSRLADVRQSMAGYGAMKLTYFNMHIYAPITNNDVKSSPGTVGCGTSGGGFIEDTLATGVGLDSLMEWGARSTGLPGITNEVGVRKKSTRAISDLLTYFFTKPIPMFAWFSGEGGAGGETLHNADGTLTPLGLYFVYKLQQLGYQ